jgi:hypothetical protein
MRQHNFREIYGGSLMKLAVTALAAFLAMGTLHASAAVRIEGDNGGQIGDYLQKYRALRQSGERVEIDGVCASACTMLLGTIPQDRICVTSRAILEFHGAWDPTPWGGEVANSAGDRILWSTYPARVRRWISRHGGLGSRIIALRGRELAAMYPRCP